jgi:hypothetical protein
MRDGQFTRRVRVERTVLASINAAFPQFALSALTPEAIDLWEMGIERVDRTFVASLVGALRETGRRLSIDADNSRDVFASDSDLNVRPVEALVSEISRLCLERESQAMPSMSRD